MTLLPSHQLVKTLALALAVTALAPWPEVASAQDMGAAPSRIKSRADRERDREERSDDSESSGAQAGDAMFPNATRKEPKAEASARISRQLEKLQTLNEDEKYDEAIQLADGIAGDSKANDYERSFALQAAAFAWLDKNDYSKAAEDLQKALDANGLPNDSHYQLMYQLAQLQLSEDKYDQALATADKFLAETRSTKPEHLVLKGNALYRLERYPEAAQILKQAIDSSDKPEDSWVQLLMGSYADAGNTAEATRLAEELYQKNPGDKRAMMNLASIYMESEQDAKAAALLDDARKQGKLTEEDDYRRLYALYANMDGKQNETIAVVNEGLEKGILKPSAEAYTVMAQAYYYSERPNEAIAAYQKAGPLAKDGEAYLNLARLLSGEGRDAEAKAAAQQAKQKGLRDAKDADTIIAKGGQ